MTSKAFITEELAAISPTLAAIPTRNVFSVPDGYFEHLSSIITAQLDEINPGFLPGTSSPLTVPAGYFDGLAGNILAKIKSGQDDDSSTEIMALSPTIARIGKTNVFQVPAGYFDTVVPGTRSVLPAPAKVISIKRKTGIVRYMAAAVISGLMGLSLFSILNNKDAGTGTVAGADVSSTLMADAGRIIKNNSFNQELESVSDKDIEQYLAQNGQDVNAALVASSVDDSNLPAAEDYLLDENTLDEFLNKANLN